MVRFGWVKLGWVSICSNIFWCFSLFYLQVQQLVSEGLLFQWLGLLFSKTETPFLGSVIVGSLTATLATLADVSWLLGIIHKPRGQLRGRGGVSQTTILLRKAHLIKWPRRGRGVKIPIKLNTWFMDYPFSDRSRCQNLLWPSRLYMFSFGSLRSGITSKTWSRITRKHN